MLPREVDSLKEYRVLVDAEEVPVDHPVRRFHDYYLSKRGADGYLDRAALDPADIVTLLPWVQILEETAPGAFGHRLVGTALVSLLGVDNTGKPFGHGISADLKRARIEEFDQAFSTGKAVFSCSSLMQEDRKFIQVIRGIFPGRAGDTRLVFMPLAPEGTSFLR